jgi:F-type H+-transporting ATPase subunit b
LFTSRCVFTRKNNNPYPVFVPMLKSIFPRTTLKTFLPLRTFTTAKVVTPSTTNSSSDQKELTVRDQALKWLECIPGQDKSYNLYMGIVGGSLLLGKEIFPYTVDAAYALPFFYTIHKGIQFGSTHVSAMVEKMVKEDDKFWRDSKVRAESHLEEEIQKITGSGISDLVEVTSDLFDYAEELVEMEAKSFEHEQSLAYYTKAKQILDEWVRYESALREREQKRIAEFVIAKVMKSVEDSKFQNDYLQQCLSDVKTCIA